MARPISHSCCLRIKPSMPRADYPSSRADVKQ
jgi:hypothetical protein